ncbi:hypothetical protein [Rhizobium hainanense]|nr:hypothetical protein [Rhizobium hainanense]
MFDRVRTYLCFGVEYSKPIDKGVSGSGKTSVDTELQRRGYHVLHGDRELAYKGDPLTGRPLDFSTLDPSSLDMAFRHNHHLWDVEKVKSLLAYKGHRLSFFCGGSRNFHRFINFFDEVFVLDLDVDTLKGRLSERPQDEFGGKPVNGRHRMTPRIFEISIACDADLPLISAPIHTSSQVYSDTLVATQ